jgi:nicotinamidase-related amidase
MMPAMARGLLIIDIQRDYFPGGAHPLVEPEPAAANARRVLDAFRESGEPVVHLQHVWDAPDAAFMKPGTDGVAIHEAVAPAAGEAVLQKAEPNGFVGTGLEDELRGRGVDELVVAGMMSSMCVDATVRAAVDLGFTATVVHDACAAPDLEFGGQRIPGATVHGAFMAALGSGYATLAAAGELAAERATD